MKKELLYKIYIAVAVFLCTLITYFSFQNEAIYNHTLAKVCYNFERGNSNYNLEINPVKKPYEKLTDKNLYRWDATLYKTIMDSSYVSNEYYNNERYAFYPLFPVVWKLTCIDGSFIFIFCYAIFILSLFLLSHYLDTDNLSNSYFTFAIALIVPSAMVFYLPYAECIFMLTFALAIIGLFKQKYWLFFLGALLFTITRPASLIFGFALLAIDFRNLIQHKQLWFFIKDLFFKTLPFGLGFVLVTVIQYYYSGSWTAYSDALLFWPTESGYFNKIEDWSLQGFGMTAFAIFFFAFPSLFYCIVWGLKAFKKSSLEKPISLFAGNSEVIKEYLFNACVAFTAGNLVYTFLTAGGCLNGFYRYTMSVPTFYVILFLFQSKLKDKTMLQKTLAFILCFIFMMVSFYFIVYGSGRFRFAYVGLYVSMLCLIYTLFQQQLSLKLKIGALVCIAIPAIIWHTYLFNMYIGDTWLFT